MNEQTVKSQSFSNTLIVRLLLIGSSRESDDVKNNSVFKRIICRDKIKGEGSAGQ
jgi:hypothetical protein